MIRAKNAFAAPLFAIVLLLVLAAVAQANTIVVNDTGDPSGAGDCPNSGQCSLRQAVGAASSGDTIQLADSTYSLTQGTNIEISKNLTIAGSGVDATVIDGSGNGQVRILRVDAGTVVIQDLSINNGTDGHDEAFQSCSPCETINANGGGSLFNDGGNVTLNDVAFNGELTSSNPLGGAISNAFGNLTMTDVSFTNEQAAAGGATVRARRERQRRWRHVREQRQRQFRRWCRVRAEREPVANERDDRRQRMGLVVRRQGSRTAEGP